MEDNHDDIKMQRQRTAHNNANNIRNAANAAAASKNPYAMAAGGALKAADKLTGGKASEKLGSAQEKLNRHNPVGKKMQDASNKLSENGSGDKSKKSDVGAKNLRSSLAKSGLNIFNNRNKRKKGTENSNNEENNQNDNQESVMDDAESVVKKVKTVKRVFIIVSILLAILLPLFLVIIVVASVYSVFGSLFSFLFPMSDAEFNEMMQNKYYAELLDKNYNESYEKLCGEKLNINLIHSALIYRYYIGEEELGPEAYDGMYFLLRSWARDGLIGNPPTKCIDFSKGGEYYNYLRDSASDGQTFKGYYGSLVQDGYGGIDSSKVDQILDEIFDLAEMVSFDNSDTTVMPEELEVTNVNNSTVPIKEYLAGVIYANVDKDELTDSEKVKAYTIAYTTNILSKNNISVNTQNISADTLKDIKYCDISTNCNGKGVMSDIIKNNVNSSIDSVYGNVLVDKDGKYNTLSVDSLNNAEGNDYKAILLNAYNNYSIKDAKEDVYDNGVNYGNEKVLTEVIFYDQNDYSNYKFCGLKNETIATSGCGTTSMAIIASTYENNRKYDPVYMSEEARKGKYCSKGNGTYYGLFKHEASVLGYKYLAVHKTSDVNKLNIVTSHLRKGHLIVVHMGAGHFTSGGHYMVLGGIDPETKKVYVYDPYNKMNSKYRKTGNGWYNFNDILKETKPASSYIAFQIIWKE